jgi:hypothetical protein
MSRYRILVYVIAVVTVCVCIETVIELACLVAGFALFVWLLIKLLGVVVKGSTGSKTTTTKLPPSHKEYKWIKGKMESTIKPHVSGTVKGYDILKIEKIENEDHWRRYRAKRIQIAKEIGGSSGMTKEEEVKKANERWLFHGTDKAGSILKNGFDVKHASPNGMFGAGEPVYYVSTNLYVRPPTLCILFPHTMLHAEQASTLREILPRATSTYLVGGTVHAQPTTLHSASIVKG